MSSPTQWPKLQDAAERLTQALFNARDLHALHNKPLDAPLSMRVALDDLAREVHMWQRKPTAESVMASKPKISDMRYGSQDHACSGTWVYQGLNMGGHEAYYCEQCDTCAIRPHVNSNHVCDPVVCLMTIKRTTAAIDLPLGNGGRVGNSADHE